MRKQHKNWEGPEHGVSPIADQKEHDCRFQYEHVECAEAREFRAEKSECQYDIIRQATVVG